MAGRDRNIGERGTERGGNSLFRPGVSECEQQGDGNRFWREFSDRLGDALDFLFCNGQDGTVRSHPLVDADHVFARNERRRMIARQIVQRCTVLAPEPEQVFESSRGNQHDTRASTLEQRIGGHGGAVHEHIDRLSSEGIERTK